MGPTEHAIDASGFGQPIHATQAQEEDPNTLASHNYALSTKLSARRVSLVEADEPSQLLSPPHKQLQLRSSHYFSLAFTLSNHNGSTHAAAPVGD
jgi:hypothetical protein